VFFNAVFFLTLTAEMLFRAHKIMCDYSRGFSCDRVGAGVGTVTKKNGYSGLSYICTRENAENTFIQDKRSFARFLNPSTGKQQKVFLAVREISSFLFQVKNELLLNSNQ
jgi:hypothetical protein